MRKQGLLSVTTEVEVGFHDIDLAQVTWHGHYLKYLENARWALMDKIGYGLETMLSSGEGFPIVGVQVKFIRVSRYKDRLRVLASLIEWHSRLVINYLVTDCANGQRVARAQTTQIAVDIRTGTMLFELPPAFVARAEAAIAQLM